MSINCNLCKKRAQIFTVNGEFIPSKTSVYLRTALYDNYSYFNLLDSPVFEAANFTEIQKDTISKIYATDNVTSGFVSKSVLFSDANGGSNYPIIYYPIKAGIPGDYDVYIRRLSSSVFNANILIDGVVQDTISDSLSLSWTWSVATITISDTNQHILGVQLDNNNIYLDQIFIQTNGSSAPVGAKDFTESPYNTIHSQLYSVIEDKPNLPMIIHDYKNTIKEVKSDGWYNFDLNFLTTSGITNFNDENYALVLWSSGAREKNFVSWELVDSNEYLNLPVAAEN